jgi:CBS domain-containing protein
VAPDATVAAAVAVMNEHRIGSVVVVGERGEVLGIFTERDVLTRVVARGAPARDTKVSDVMSERVSHVSPDEEVREVLKRMTRERKRHLPVIDDGALVGMVSIGDLTDWTSRYLDELITELTEYIGGPAARRSSEEVYIFARAQM